MSWSASGRIESPEQLDELNTSPPELEGHATVMFDSAKEAVWRALTEGVVGEGKYNVSLSGHHNDGDGTNLSISISRVS